MEKEILKIKIRVASHNLGGGKCFNCENNSNHLISHMHQMKTRSPSHFQATMYILHQKRKREKKNTYKKRLENNNNNNNTNRNQQWLSMDHFRSTVENQWHTWRKLLRSDPIELMNC